MNFESRLVFEKVSVASSTHVPPVQPKPNFIDLFCGGGLVRLGLDNRWSCSLAVDWDGTKEEAYKCLWGEEAFERADVSEISEERITDGTSLVWASFPCQDLSLAGNRSGLSGSRSGYFWSVIELIAKAKNRGHRPQVLAFENVPGFVSQNGGQDFVSAIRAVTGLGYACTAIVVDAKHFVPQSRPRVFILAVHHDALRHAAIADVQPNWLYPKYLTRTIYETRLNDSPDWFWLAAGPQVARNVTLTSIMDWQVDQSAWDDMTQTQALLKLLSPLHQSKLEAVISKGERQVFGIYRRMRPTKDGNNVQRAEISFNDHAGCLRAPTGGSSRQKFLFVDGKKIRSRLPLPHELCRIMGVKEKNFSELTYNQIYRVFGEGVSPPVVSFIDEIFFSKVV